MSIYRNQGVCQIHYTHIFNPSWFRPRDWHWHGEGIVNILFAVTSVAALWTPLCVWRLLSLKMMMKRKRNGRFVKGPRPATPTVAQGWVCPWN